MGRQLRHHGWIILAAGVVFLTNLGAAALWDEDEPLYAACAHAMLQAGDWVVPVYNGELFPDKPPLMFWTMMAGFKIFGINEFGARFFSALLGIATAIATYHFGRRLFSDRVGLWAGLIVASTIIFTVSARAATVDAALTFLTTMAIGIFALGAMARKAEGENSNAELRGHGSAEALDAHPSSFILHPSSFILWAAIWACLGLAVLAKGPIGLLLPAASIGLFLMISNHRQRSPSEGASAPHGWTARVRSLVGCLGPGNFLRSLWRMRPLTGVVVVLAVALPWYILVGLRTEGAWLAQFFAKYNLRPFTEPILGHSGPVWYYIPAVLIGFFPWAVFLGPALQDTIGRIRRSHPWRSPYVLLACWFGVFFVFWSICSTKLPHYVLPAYPALALLTGCFIEGWIANPLPSGRWWPRIATAITILVGLGFVVVFPIAASIYVPGEELLGLVGLILIAGAGGFLYWVERNRRDRAVVVFAVASVVFLTAVFGFAANRVDRHQNAKPMIAAIRRDAAGDDARLAAYRFVRESTVFYAGRPVPCLDDFEQLEPLLDHPTPLYVFTKDRYEQRLAERFPGVFDVLLRRRAFLMSGEIVVLVHRGRVHPARTAEKPSVDKRR